MFVFIIIIPFFFTHVLSMELVTIIGGGGDGLPHRAGRTLVSLPRIEQAKAVKKPSPNHWKTQGTPIIFSFLK